MAAPSQPARKPLISGNWKMHHNHFEAIQMVQKLSWLLTSADAEAVEVSIHPPFTDLRSVQTVIEADNIGVSLGAQNCHHEQQGAYTGEISPQMLAKLNVRYVIVGHSERRELFGEDDGFINRKVRAVLAAGMDPILCVGETLAEREAGVTGEKIARQVRAGLAGVEPADLARIVIAYEPIWAIGTGRTATPEDAQDGCARVRSVVAETAAGAAQAVRVQYGGSVKPGNIAGLMAQPDIDGALVGGASLDAEEFAAIVHYHEQT